MTQAEIDRKAKVWRIVEALRADITDRRGFSQVWDSIDPDLRGEILNTWSKLVEENL